MIRPQMQVVFDEDVRTFVAGLAVPAEFIDEMHQRDMKVVVMCGSVRHAQKSEAPALTPSSRRARRQAATPARSAGLRSCRRRSTP